MPASTQPPGSGDAHRQTLLWRKWVRILLAAALLLSGVDLLRTVHERQPPTIEADTPDELRRHIGSYVELKGQLQLPVPPTATRLRAFARGAPFDRAVPLQNQRDEVVALVILPGSLLELREQAPSHAVGWLSKLPSNLRRSRGPELLLLVSSPPTPLFPLLLVVTFGIAFVYVLASSATDPKSVEPSSMVDWIPQEVSPPLSLWELTSAIGPTLLWLTLFALQVLFRFFARYEAYFPHYDLLVFCFTIAGIVSTTRLLSIGPTVLEISPAGLRILRGGLGPEQQVCWQDIEWIGLTGPWLHRGSERYRDSGRRWLTLGLLEDKRLKVPLYASHLPFVESLNRKMLEHHLDQSREEILNGKEIDFGVACLSQDQIRFTSIGSHRRIKTAAIRERLSAGKPCSISFPDDTFRNPLVFIELLKEFGAVPQPRVQRSRWGAIASLRWKQQR